MKLTNTTYTATGILILLLVAWMASGLFFANSDEENLATSESGSDASNTELMRVRVTEVFPQAMERKLTLQGQLHARRQILIQAETSGTIESLPVAKGARVATNALVAKLSIEGRESELKEAQARISTAASEQAATQKLQKQGLQSQLKADQAQAALASARAALERIELEIAKVDIRAPFSGVINQLPIEMGQQIDKGTVIAELVDNSSFRATASVAQQSVHKLSVGQAVKVELITGAELEGKLTFISAVADPATRSFDIEAIVENAGQQIAAGTSASVIIPVEKVEAMFVSPSTMALSDTGDIGVKTVNEENKVVFFPVALVQTDSDGAWVTGVPAGSRIITLGQGFVNENQEVEPVEAEPDANGDAATK